MKVFASKYLGVWFILPTITIQIEPDIKYWSVSIDWLCFTIGIEPWEI